MGQFAPMTMLFGTSIKKGDVVAMNYTLSSTGGEVIDRSESNRPLHYLHGYGNIVVGLEKQMEGLKVGDKKKVVVAAAEGYGEMNPQLLLKVERKNFPPDADLQVGMQFETPFENTVVIFTIDKIEGEHVMINGNHPLAGLELHFDVEVVSVRQATSEELTHGHVHGPGGAHH
jgi:FKBP-type peptidyl-prolyl cis-trans isomerase SlyD